MFQKNIKRANKWLHKTFSQRNVNRVAGYAHKKLDELKANYNKLKEGLEESETGKKWVDFVEQNPLAKLTSTLFAGASDPTKGVEIGTHKDEQPALTDEQAIFTGAT